MRLFASDKVHYDLFNVLTHPPIAAKMTTLVTEVVMQTVSIAELKAHLSEYLRRVRAGEEIVVCDRSVPIGKLVPLSLDEELDAEELELVAAGVLRLPAESDARAKKKRGARIDADRVLEALDADRDGR